MTLAKSVLVASALALAVGGAYAADKEAKTSRSQQTSKSEPGFNNLDKNNDGKLTRAEAAADKSLAAKWKEADRNNDGTLSRSEYLMVKGKQDIGTAADKVKRAVSRDKTEPSSSAGSTSKPK